MKVMNVKKSWHIDYIRNHIVRNLVLQEAVQDVSDGLGEVLPITPLSIEGITTIIYEDDAIRRVLVVSGQQQDKILQLYPETELQNR